VGEFRVAVLVSGTGSNLQAILDKLHGRDGIVVVGVASNRANTMALERAEHAGVESGVFATDAYASRADRDAAIADWLGEREVDLVVLASFPGMDAIGQALRHGVKVTGVTVHFVDEGVDSGPIILQRPVEISSADEAELEERIHRIEHELLPEAIRMIATGAVRIDEDNPRLVVIDEHEDTGSRD
jgi:phosphoribosylglycinamide formyltransferase-1